MGTDFDVVVVGSCNMDLISYAPRLPKPGETLIGHKFQMGCGGKGANQCVMAAKLCAKTAMVGRVGNDTFGEIFMKNFEDLGINTEFLKVTEGASSGVAPITVNNSGENSIIIIKGANDAITTDDLTNALPVIQSAKVVICQNEIKPEVTLAALQLAQKLGVRTIFNPAPAIAGLSSEFLKCSEVVCCNETEAEILTGLTVNTMEECKAAVSDLLSKGPQKVILTLGSKGALCASADDQEPGFVPAKEMKAVDTTGAGDAFVGSLAYYMACQDNLSLRDMVERAGYIAGVSVTKEGTQCSYPSRDSLPACLF